MHSQIEFLKKAVMRGDTMGVLNCYVVRGGQIMARDGSLQAGAPFPALITDDFNVPAGELDAVLSRIKMDVDLVHADGVATVRGKRLRVDISCVVDEPPAVTLPEDGWHKVPSGFLAALKLTTPFVLDKLQNFGIRLMGDRITVISNRAGIDVSIPALCADECCMSLQCAEFLTSQDEDPAEYCQTEDAVAFRWKDDRWVRAQLLQKSFPNTVEAIFKAAGDTCPVLVDDEWREAYGDVSALADDVVEIHPDRMVAVRSTSRVESSIMTQIPEGTCSHWSVRSLDPVIAIATQWNPAAWPRPATFKGANFRGVVVGASTG